MLPLTARELLPTLMTLAVATALCGACGSSLAGAIPVQQYQEPAADTAGEYVISAGDVLTVQVWDQPQISGRMRVRTDGRISLPFLNDVHAEGKTPTKFAAELEAGLKSVVLNPRVTVSVEESKPLAISVIGEVIRPGVQAYDREGGVAQAIAAAGGLTNFAKRDRIFVVRRRPKPARIHFTYDDLIRGIGPASAFQLRPGDVVVVE